MLATALMLSLTLGEPQGLAGTPTPGMPRAISSVACPCCTLRSVGADSAYSRLRLAKPASDSGSPMLPATAVMFSPESSMWKPRFASTATPCAESFRTKFNTPAMASEPYWAAAPSRSTSMRSRAMAGMADMSGPWAPFEAPLEIHWITAPRCRRLLFTSTRVWSGASPRRLTGRKSAARSRDGLSLTWNDGTSARIRFVMSLPA